MKFSTMIYGVAAAAGVANAAAVDNNCILTGKSLDKVAQIKAKCDHIMVKDFTVPAGKTLELTNLRRGATVTFAGVTTMDYAKWAGPVFLISGEDIHVTGAPGHRLDGNGKRWWDKAGDPHNQKPKFMRLRIKGKGKVDKLYVRNTPKMAFSVNSCDGLVLENIRIDNREGNGLAKNTDGFDVSSSNNIILRNNKVYNQDDCLAINKGDNIQFLNNECWYGHGISIGSVGHQKGDSVTRVVVKGNKVIKSDNGLRIKTIMNAVGKVDDIQFLDNTLTEINKFGIVIQGDYLDGTTTGKPTGSLPITNLKVIGNQCSVNAKASPVKVLVVNAKNWVWSGNTLSGGRAYNNQGVPAGVRI